MAFGKDFGGMAQGDDKTGQKGTNSIFVMTYAKIKQAYADKVTFTYAKIVVDFRPQKEDPYQFRITAGGNLLTYGERFHQNSGPINIEITVEQRPQH